MIFASQTSLIPVQVALTRFWEQGGNIFGNYPYWYLGTTPFRYLTGPVLPAVLVGLHRILPALSLFEIFFGVIGVCWVVGGIGVYSLVVSLANSFTSERRSPPSEECIRPPRRRFALMAAVFYIFGPMVPLLFRFSDGLYLVAFSFLPFTLLMYLKMLKKWTRGRAVALLVTICFLMLLDSLIIPTLILGMAAVFLAQVGWKRAEEKLKQTFLIFAFSFLISTLWYTPGYWLTLLGAPSLAGKGLFSVIGELTKLLPTALALVIAVVSVKFFKEKNKLRDFCFYWLFTYVFLTLLRFLSDPDFWMDWTAYGIELQFGMAIGLGLVLNNLLATPKHRIPLSGSTEALNKFSVSGLFSVSVFLMFLFGSWLFLFNRYVLGTLQGEIERTVEYRIGKELDEKVRKGEKVFLSGSTAFWLNAFFDVAQVRGGVDQAATNESWRKAAWEIREGVDAEDSLKWLKDLDVSYLVVHTSTSSEFYHDFKSPEKFEGVGGLKKVYDEEGDRIYQVLN
jgi:hypothetical protein